MTGVLVGSADIKATSGILTPTASGKITVVAGAASKIKVETAADGSGTVVPTQNVPTGSSIIVYAITRDAAGNFVANVGADAWSLENISGGVVGADLVPSGDKKNATFTGALLGSADIKATSGILTPTLSGKITVTPVPTKVRVETAADGSGTVVSAQSLASGASIIVYAISRDASNVFVANVAADAWSLESISGGVVGADLVPSGDKKSAVFKGAVIGTAEIKATSGALATTNSGTITVTVGTATKIRVETKDDGTGVVVPGQSIASGSAITVYSITRDYGNNFVANAAATWTLENKTGGVAAGDLVPAGDSKSAVFTAGTIGTCTVKAVSGALATTESGTLSVTVGPATKVRVETKNDGTGTVVPGQSVTSGNSITVYSITRDYGNNFVANVAADAWSLESISGGVAAGDLVPAGDSKSAVFKGAVIGTAEIKATSGALATTNSGTITVTAGTATQIRVETKDDGSGTIFAAQNITAGNTLSGYAITRDANNNFVANVAVTWTMIATTGGVVAGDLVPAGDNKSAVFTGKLVGTGQIEASSGILTKTPTGTLTVKPAAASAFVVSGIPTPITAGTSASVTITAKDPYGNTATGYAGTVHLTSSDTQAGLPGDYTFVPGDGGVKTITGVILKTASTQSVTVTDTTTPSVNGSQSGIMVDPAAASAIVVSGIPNPVDVGTSASATVTAYDPYNNIATGYTGTVNFTSTDSKATLPANYTFVAADNGTRNFSGLILETSGNQTITAGDGALSGSQTVKVDAKPSEAPEPLPENEIEESTRVIFPLDQNPIKPIIPMIFSIPLAYGAEVVNTAMPVEFGFNFDALLDTNMYKRHYLPGGYVTIVTVLDGRKISVDIFSYDDKGSKNKKALLLNKGEQVTEQSTIK
jgi:hypothetical protein